jgi:hypothetical protein
MTKDVLAKALTAILVVALPAVVALRKKSVNATPQATIFNMMADARKGDAKSYLSRYTGEMEASLKQAIAERTEAGFNNYLRSSNAEIKGVAVQEPKPLSDREVELDVEYIYQDRNEAQKVYLEKTSGGWKIARVESIERVKTLVPYGTPVQ